MKTKNILILGGIGLVGIYMINKARARQAAIEAASDGGYSDDALGAAKGWTGWFLGTSKAMGDIFRDFWDWSEREAEEREVPESDATEESEEESSIWGDFVDFVTGE
jgi:hypothetical protein